MFSKKRIAALGAAVLASLLVFDACALWTSGSTEVNLGGFLSSSYGSSKHSAYLTGIQPISSILAGSTLMNNTTVNNSSAIRLQPAAVLDLSGYASSRRNNSLQGYVNIMYPLAEASGFTATVGSGSGGGGGGCGCGG